MRRRKSTASGAKRIIDEPGKASHILINYAGPSFSDLPGDILVNILVRLPTKRVFVSKGVCKAWYDVILDPEFAKLHFEQAQVYHMVRTSNQISDHECFCHVKVDLKTKFELPLCNLHMIHHDEDISHNMHDPDSGAESNKCMKLNMKDHTYSIVNSCNSLLCLWDPSDNDPLIVCNPITGEFMNLPEAKKFGHHGLYGNNSFIHGFGFSAVTNQYKVIRVRECWLKDANGSTRGIVAEVHVLGTELWKSIGSFCRLTCEKVSPIYLDGFLYLFSDFHRITIMSFDMEKECFESFAGSPLKNDIPYNNIGMGVLGEELCMTGIHEQSFFNVVPVQVWVIKGCGAQKEWSKIFSFELHSNLVLYGPFHPIKYLNDGALLMFQPKRQGLVYKNLRKFGFRFLDVLGMESTGLSSRVEIIDHIPSFVSLKHALSLSGQNIEVLNVKSSGYAELELHNEDKAISLVLEDEEESESDYEDWESDFENRAIEFFSKDSSGGVVLASRDGKIVCENTLDARLDVVFGQKLPESASTAKLSTMLLLFTASELGPQFLRSTPSMAANLKCNGFVSSYCSRCRIIS